MGKGTIIVTGGGQGIGLAIARRLAREGYDLALVDINPETVAAAADGLEPQGRHFGLAANVADWDEVQAAVKEIHERNGEIHGLVNNAGITRDALILRMSPEQWKQVIDVNLTGTFFFTKAVGAIMLRQKTGRMVNIASVIGISGNAGQANYAASKAGIIALTKSVARELGGRSVTVNAIAPGFIATDMTARLPEQVKADMLKSIPLKRFGEVDDIAGLVAFLMSPDASYITGQTLVCDGGMVL